MKVTIRDNIVSLLTDKPDDGAMLPQASDMTHPKDRTTATTAVGVVWVKQIFDKRLSSVVRSDILAVYMWLGVGTLDKTVGRCVCVLAALNWERFFF